MRKKCNLKIILFLVLFFFVFYILFINFLNGVLESDFVSHTKDALKGEYYSLAILLMKFAMLISKNYNYVIAFFMSLIVMLTMYLVVLFIRYLLKQVLNIEIKDGTIWAIGVSSVFICKICIPFLSPLFYVKSYVTQPWHNSTYLCMRLCALPTLIYFYKIRLHYLEKLEIIDCLLFTVLLTITNYAKPNFIIVFAPIMLCVLVYDFVKTRGKSFKNAFIFGCCVLISCVILFYQSKLLFSTSENTGIRIGLDNINELLYMNYHDVFNIIASLAFPLVVLVLFMLKRNELNLNFKRVYFETWMMFLLSILVRLFIFETGDRALHGNFAWSSYFFAFMLFLVSICMLLHMIKKNSVNKYIKYGCFVIYGLHILSGLVYFVLVYTNTLVFMT